MSIFVTIVLVAIKILAGVLSGSLAILSLASESALDMFAVLLSMFAVRVAYLPADEDHPYGHGKFDSLVSLFQSIALLGVSIWIFSEAYDRLSHPSLHPLEITLLTLSILIGSFILDGWRSWKLHHTGKKAASAALQTDALHFLVDGLSSLAVLAGILAYVLFGWASADNYAAIGVSLFVMYLSLKQGKEAIDALTDRLDRSKEYATLREAIEAVDGVLSTRKLRMRRSGPVTFIDGGIEINRVLPFASVQHILDACEDASAELVQGSEINFYPVPIKTRGESSFDTIKLIASEFGVLPHNIELARSDDEVLTLDLHLEFPPKSTFEDAHSLSERIEERIHAELPAIKQIVVHLEEERSDAELHLVRRLEAGERFSPEVIGPVIRNAFSSVRNVKDIELLRNETNGDLKLTSVIELDRGLSLFEAHQVSSEIERFIRDRYTDINRIVIHVEPAEVQN